MTETALTLTSETAETALLDWDLIETLCESRGARTSAERADLLGVGRASLYRWRAGGPITLDNAAKIAGRLGRSVGDILAATPKPSPPPPRPRPPAGPSTPPPPAGPAREGDQ